MKKLIENIFELIDFDKLELAYVEIKSVLAANPDMPDCYYALSVIAIKKSDLIAGEQLIETALKLLKKNNMH